MIKKTIISIVLSIFALSCGDADKIKIGSKNFTEGLIVSEIFAKKLEEKGFEVSRKFNLGGSLIHSSIINGEIDVYPEYTGTSLLAILKKKPISDPYKVYEIVKNEYKEKFNLKYLEFNEANDSNGIAVRTDIAKKYNIYTLSDLQKNADKIRFASQGEFHKREDALPLLNKVYGEFKFKTFKVYSNDLKYTVLDENIADATIVYTTEGYLVNEDKYTLLVDDKKAFPPYNIVGVVRNDLLDKKPEVEQILNEVSKKLTSKILIKLNALVDIDKLTYEEAADKFLKGELTNDK